MWKVLILLLVSCKSISTLPNGAATAACMHMTPGHGDHSPQVTVAPITIVTSTDTLQQGRTMYLTIQADDGFAFAGFMIQARSLFPSPQEDIHQVIGRFHSRPGMWAVNCIDHPSDSVFTHVSPVPKTRVQLIWEAPNDFIGLVTFYISIVQRFDTFWTGLQSDWVSVTWRDPEEPEPEPEVPEPPTIDGENIYNGCNDTKVCFGYPQDCLSSQDCELFGAVRYDSGRFLFELLSATGASYIAMGLSDDDRMGRDSVIECVAEAQVNAYTSFTSVQGVDGSPRIIDQSIIRLQRSLLVDGRIYCLVERDTLTTVDNMIFDLYEKHFLLLAGGTKLRVDSVGIHNMRAASDSAMFLTEPEDAETDPPVIPEIPEIPGTPVLILLHGSFMIVAWIGLTSIAIIFARHFKATWTNRKIGGQDIWFVCHSICNVLTLVLTIAGVIFIFAQFGEWRFSVHAVTGVTVTTLVILQSIGAVFRPTPDAEHRPIFNSLHKASGNITHLLAIITIFYAVPLDAVGLPEWMSYILVGFVVFYLLMHLKLNVIGIYGDIKRSKEPKSKKEQPFTLLRKTLLGMIIIIILFIVIALVLILAFSPF